MVQARYQKDEIVEINITEEKNKAIQFLDCSMNIKNYLIFLY